VEFYSEDDLERSGLYNLFSLLFMQEPSAEILMHVREMFGLDFDETMYEIRTDFNFLFSEPEGHLLPYESLYNYPVWDISRLCGKATESVQKSYRTAGLTIDEELDLIPDHLSAELLFMSYLIEHCLTEQQKTFLVDHLSAWVPEYCNDVQRYSRTTFYKEVAYLLDDFIFNECEDFGIKIK
jgi:TorA maturation chaperone TorD